jgi:hypothetical protein
VSPRLLWFCLLRSERKAIEVISTAESEITFLSLLDFFFFFGFLRQGLCVALAVLELAMLLC